MKITDEQMVIWNHIFKKTDNLTKPAKFSRTELGCFGIFDIQIILDMLNNVVRKGDMKFNADGIRQEYYNLPDGDLTEDSLDYYFENASILNQGKSITLTKDFCLEYSVALKHKVALFTKGYAQSKDIMIPGVNGGLEVGNHKSNSKELRQFFCDSFEFNLLGNKRLLLWPPCYFNLYDYEQQPVSNGLTIKENYLSDHAAYAYELKVGKNEMAFIPRDWWRYSMRRHLSPTLTLDIGVFDKVSTKKLTINALNRIYSKKIQRKGMIKCVAVDYNELNNINMVLPTEIDNIILDYQDSLAVSLAQATDLVRGEIESDSLLESVLFNDLVVTLVDDDMKIIYTLYKDTMICFSNGQFKQFINDDLTRQFLETIIEKGYYILDETILSNNVMMLISWLNQISCIRIGEESKVAV